MTFEINTDDFWKEIDRRVVEYRIEKKLMSDEITTLRLRVAELETVLRECKEVLECVPAHFGMKRLGKSTLKDSETRIKCHIAIAKIDEVLK